MAALRTSACQQKEGALVPARFASVWLCISADSRGFISIRIFPSASCKLFRLTSVNYLVVAWLPAPLQGSTRLLQQQLRVQDECWALSRSTPAALALLVCGTV